MLIRKSLSHDATLKLALELEKGATAFIECQKILPHNKVKSIFVWLKVNRNRHSHFSRIEVAAEVHSASKAGQTEEILSLEKDRVISVVTYVQWTIGKFAQLRAWNTGLLKRRDILRKCAILIDDESTEWKRIHKKNNSGQR